MSYVEPNGSWTGSLERDAWNRPLNKSNSAERASGRARPITTASAPTSKRLSKHNGPHTGVGPHGRPAAAARSSAEASETGVDAEKVKRLKSQLKKLEAAEKKAHTAYLKERSRLEEALGAIGHENALGFIGYLDPAGLNGTE